MFLIFLAMAAVSALYGTAGQAGGSGFIAVMTFASFPLDSIRPTGFALNVVAATYATWRMHRADAIDWPLLRNLLVTSVPASFVGGTIVLQGPVYAALTGALLLLTAILMVMRVTREERETLGRTGALLAGALTGLVSGITGVGGGVFLSSILILFGQVSPEKTPALSPPYVAVNSAAALTGMLLGSAPAAIRASLRRRGDPGLGDRHRHRSALDVALRDPRADPVRGSRVDFRQNVWVNHQRIDRPSRAPKS